MTRILTGLLAFAFCLPVAAESPAQKRAEVQKMRAETLARLYKYYPAAKARIANAYGYAVFSNAGINVILISVAGGRGVAHDNKTGRNHYMRMISGGIGPGIGAKDFRGIFVFESKRAFDKFVTEGWEAGARAEAMAKADNKGGAAEAAVTVARDVKFYQLTEAGLSLEATIQGTKYFKDGDLNGK